MASISPDCRDGNHQKCDGVAWDEELDDKVECDDFCHSHLGEDPFNPDNQSEVIRRNTGLDFGTL